MSKRGEASITNNDSVFCEVLEPVCTKRGLCIIVRGNGIKLKIPLAQLVAKLWIKDFNPSDDVTIEHEDDDPLNCATENLDVLVEPRDGKKPKEVSPISFVTKIGYEAKVVVEEVL